MPKGMLLRVGIDRGCGGSLGPLFGDGSFEYIPIPEGKPTRGAPSYAHLMGRCGRPLSEFVRAPLRDAIPHNDPEFATYTYGDPTSNKRRQLLRLDRGDVLAFYAGLQPWNGEDVARLYIIGYLTVKAVHDVDAIERHALEALKFRLCNQAHFLRDPSDQGLVVVEGDPATSKLLERAVPLGDPTHSTLRDLDGEIGYDGSLLRATGHWIDDGVTLASFMRWVDKGPPSLVQSDDRLFSYVVANDKGFAPNPQDGTCTLACCKPRIRGTAKEGDWVLGTCPKAVGPARVTFLMRVNEVLSFDQYHRDEQWQKRRDNIYYRGPKGTFIQVPNHYHDKSDIPSDTKADRVLLGSIYWYFGEKHVPLPSELADEVYYPFIGDKPIDDPDVIRSVVDWAWSRFRLGAHGPPRDMTSSCGPRKNRAKKKSARCS